MKVFGFDFDERDDVSGTKMGSVADRYLREGLKCTNVLPFECSFSGKYGKWFDFYFIFLISIDNLIMCSCQVFNVNKYSPD